MDKLMKWGLAPALVLVMTASVAGAEPATPAVPGGGNPSAVSDNAATPAEPAVRAEMPGPEDMQADEAGKFSDKNPVLGGEAKAKWEAMTPEEKKQFMQEHPKLRKAMFRKKWEKMSPAERGAFIENHPEMKEKMKARWEAMTPEERQAFLASHPKIEKRWKKRQAARKDGQGGKEGEGMDKDGNGGNGVRDHGAGEGRDGVGQGGEHRGGAMHKKGPMHEGGMMKRAGKGR